MKADRRSSDVNRFFHHVLQQISDSLEWDGDFRPVDYWKRLVIAAWSRVRSKEIALATAIDGDGIDVVYIKTSKLTSEEVMEAAEYAIAWAADKGVIISTRDAPKR